MHANAALISRSFDEFWAPSLQITMELEAQTEPDSEPESETVYPASVLFLVDGTDLIQMAQT